MPGGQLVAGAGAHGSVNATPGQIPGILAARADFPLLARPMNGRPLAFLDSAASAQKPRVVLDSLRDFYESEYANVHRGVYLLSAQATDRYEAAREVVRRFLNARCTEEIVFARGATEAINLVAGSLGRSGRLAPDDEIVLTVLEHHSNIVPWQLMRDSTGVRVRAAAADAAGNIDVDAVFREVGDRTRLIAFSHVSNTTGTVLPAREICHRARARGILTLVDGCQAVPHAPVDVQELACDFYTFSGHKLYGPSGIGALYGRHDLLTALPPWQGGGSMIEEVTFERTTYAPPPARYEAGTPNIAGAVGLAAAIGYVQSLGIDAIRRHEDRILQYGVDRLQAADGVRLIGTPRQRAGSISFVFDGVHPHDVGTVLDQEGVAVRVGHHCAQPAMRHFGVPATIRASLGVYTHGADLDALVAGLGRAKELFLP